MLTMDYKEKKEIIVDCYKNTFDRFLSYKKCGCTVEEIENLEKDSDFQMRLDYFLIEQRERIVKTLDNLMNTSDKDEIRLKAATKLGEILYSEVFNKKEPDKIEMILPLETQKRLKDILNSGQIDIWKEEIKEKLMNKEENQNVT